MNELIATVSAKTGLSEEQSQHVVNTVLGYLKDRLPAPLASHLDGLIGTETPAAEGAAGDGTPSEESGGLLQGLAKKIGL